MINTDLYLAVKNDQIHEVYKCIKSHNAEVALKFEPHKSPLKLAIKHNKNEIAEILIDAPFVDVIEIHTYWYISYDAQTKHLVDLMHYSCLQVAASAGNQHCVNLLCIRQLLDASPSDLRETLSRFVTEIESTLLLKPIQFQASLLCEAFISKSERLSTIDEKVSLLEKALSGTNAFSVLMMSDAALGAKIHQALDNVKNIPPVDARQAKCRIM